MAALTSVAVGAPSRRVLFCARPAFGHVYPLIPLALAARAAGHDVSFASAGTFVARLQALGFPTFDVGMTLAEAYEALLGDDTAKMPRGDDGRPDPEMGGRFFIDVMARATAADLVPLLAENRPDVVVYEHYDLGAAVAARRAGLRAVCTAISPRPPRDLLEVFCGDRLDRLWAAHSVSPGGFDVFTGDVYLDIFPDVLQPQVIDDPARVRMRSVPFAEPGVTVPSWVGQRTRPLIYLTLGTIVATDEVLQPAIDGLSTIDADLLVALGSADGSGLGRLPDNVHVESFVDQPKVLNHADLVVHHGGSGTILAALAAGTPQLLLPKGADQFYNADAMAATGLATVLEPRDATADAVATLAKIALEDDHPAAEATRAELAALPHPADVLDVLQPADSAAR
ncbi:MAG: eryC [Desertimonas sp.]|nr:eryC [Desertimonas sp.]